jgi:hypothetical protein
MYLEVSHTALRDFRRLAPCGAQIRLKCEKAAIGAFLTLAATWLNAEKTLAFTGTPTHD